jgi:hypothetical protein
MAGVNLSEQLKAIQEAEDRKTLAVAKASTQCWGYREADTEEGYERKLFPDKAAREKAGYVDTPHAFKVEAEKANEALAELERRKAVEARKAARAKLLAEAGYKKGDKGEKPAAA